MSDDPNQQIQFRLTRAEADQLAHLLDVSIRSGGVETAMSAVPIFKKLQEAVKAQQQNEVAARRGIAEE